ncbi:MAG: hypothetical protein EOO15_21085 [Chitinophagaceae bacterium]|nr:MAG: hypothetical protein EOO15_21085 [Chitinophagaceae bacterium]
MLLVNRIFHYRDECAQHVLLLKREKLHEITTLFLGASSMRIAVFHRFFYVAAIIIEEAQARLAKQCG